MVDVPRIWESVTDALGKGAGELLGSWGSSFPIPVTIAVFLAVGWMFNRPRAMTFLKKYNDDRRWSRPIALRRRLIRISASPFYGIDGLAGLIVAKERESLLRAVTSIALCFFVAAGIGAFGQFLFHLRFPSEAAEHKEDRQKDSRREAAPAEGATDAKTAAATKPRKAD